MSNFIGRETELTLLKELTRKQSASLVVIRGCRLIGKSRLIEEMILASQNVEQTKLLKQLDVNSGGNIIQYLEELIDAGFIERHYTWSIKSGRVSTLSQYRCLVCLRS
jgi:AAA+ ATPase superfamily predicted ATPase